MNIPPRKPHFFKPILPGFKNGLNIPIGFLKYLKGHEHIEHAVLKRAGKKCLVKVNGQRFEEGWEKFAEKHDLQVGDMLIFRHEGDMEFDVSIFDTTHCDREYGEFLQQEEGKDVEDEDNEEVDDEEEEEAVHTGEETSMDFESTEPSPRIESSGEASSLSEAATHKTFGHSWFACTIKPYCLTYGYLRIPKNFAFANGLITNKKYDLLIRDEKQRSWNLKLHSCETQSFIGDGWRKFITDNCLKEGYHIMFEVVTDGETPIWKFHVVTAAETPMRKFHKATKDRPLGSPHFIYTIKTRCISKSILHVPKLFARENGLNDRKCKITIRDEQQRSWVFNLYSADGSTFIGGGWCKFCSANLLKEGDHVMFETFSKGEEPVWKFHDLRANASLQPEEKKPNLDAIRVFTQENATDKPKPNVTSSHKDFPDVEVVKDMRLGRPHFVYTITPSTITKYLLNIPKLFARENGLSNRKCKVTIRDEQQRSWEFKMYTSGGNTLISGKWYEFCAANFLEEGDRIMFELFSNEEEPILKFHDMRAKYASVQPEEKRPKLDAKRVSTPGIGIEAADIPAPTSSNANPHFVSTIKPYTLSRSFLCLPTAFVKSNGLMDHRKMILSDEKRRSWSVLLRQRGKHFAITCGLQQFMIANGLKAGDAYKFELIDNRKIPIVYFHCKYPWKDA